MRIEIIIAGDVVVLTNSNKFTLRSIDENLSMIIQDADYSLVNLEAPVITQNTKPIDKTGSNLSQKSEVINGLKSIGFDCVTLANNHFRDYGQEGCENTIKLLETNGINYVGGGNNIYEAEKILYKDINGIKVAFINVCEKEWSIATEERFGANPLNPIRQFYQIKDAKKIADYCIVITHGGTEHYQLPAPHQKQLFHFFIDAGADAIVNHHQHCFSGYEIYKGRPIFYGIGNFLFDSKSKIYDIWNYGYIVRLQLGEGEVNFDIIPYEQCNGKFGVFERINKEDFYSELYKLNDIIVNEDELSSCWKNFISNNRDFYNPAIVPFRSRVLNKLYRMKLLPSFMSKYQLRYIYDIVNCYSHRVRFLEFLENKIK